MAKHTHVDFEQFYQLDLPEPQEGEVSITLVTDESRDKQYLEPIGLEDEPNLHIITVPTADGRGGGISLASIVESAQQAPAYTFVMLIGTGVLQGIGKAIGERAYAYLSDKLIKALSGHETQARYCFQRLDGEVTLIVDAPANLEPANVRELVGLSLDFLMDPGNIAYLEAVYDSKHGELIHMKDYRSGGT